MAQISFTSKRATRTQVGDECGKGDQPMLNLIRVLRSAAPAAARTVWMATGCVLLAGSAVAQIQVTSLQGTATAAGRPLSLHSEIGENLPIEVPVGARCSVLLSDQALVHLCDGARASFSETRVGIAGTVELDAGQLKMIAPDRAPVSVHTPAASIVLQGTDAHISVAPDSGDTVVSVLEGELNVSPRGKTDTTRVKAGQQLILRRGQAPGNPRTVSRESLARDNACASDSVNYGVALRAERTILIGGVPAVSAGPDGAAGHVSSDLQQIVRADIAEGGLAFEDSATPSTLITELGKRGMDEEICDPITCNPVYELPPGPCGVPPVPGCTP